MVTLLALLFAAQETVDIPGTKLKFQMVSVPGGKAKVGDETLREVDLRPFQMGVKEVTWAEYNAFRNSKDLDAVTRPTKADSYFGDAGIPSEWLAAPMPHTNARWHGAMMYCEWLSRRTGRYFRLPTETEWEVAARAGSEAASPDAINDVAWHAGNSQKSTHESGGKKANALGLFDMSGNVWEYALEPFSGFDYGPVIRGGCWSSPIRELKYAARLPIAYKWFEEDANDPRSVWWLTTPKVSIGLRVVCVADASDLKDREAYASKLEIKVAGHKSKDIKTGGSTSFYREVKGAIKNTGDRTLDEVELKVYYLEADGKPRVVDMINAKPGRATFSKCWPVLVNSANEALAGKTLAPGATRAFQVDVPLSCDIENKDNPVFSFEGKVTSVKFSK